MTKKAIRFDNEYSITKNAERISGLITNLEKALATLAEMSKEKEALQCANLLLSWCRLNVPSCYITDWKLDKSFSSEKMIISEDCLTFRVNESSGYAGIIGTVSTDDGSFAYEVIPTDLQCTGNEGFGIIEKSQYVAAKGRDARTPTVYDSMIGFFYSNSVKGLKTIRSSSLVSGSTYIVNCNTKAECVTITGPDLFLIAKLKRDTIYCPCLSVGCTSNTLKIKPIEVVEPIDTSLVEDK